MNVLHRIIHNFLLSIEMVAGIETRFFEGPPHQKSPRYSLTDFDSGLFRHVCFKESENCHVLYYKQYTHALCISRTVGEILAVSLAQGGPAPTFFSQWAYSYLCNGQINPTQLDKNTVADSQLRLLIDQVLYNYLKDCLITHCSYIISSVKLLLGGIFYWAVTSGPYWWDFKLWIHWSNLGSKQGTDCPVCCDIFSFFHMN